MPIEPTDEMRHAFADAAGWPPAPWMFGPDVERGITAVLEMFAADVRTVLAQEQQHAHRIPGVWDGAARRPCVECAARERLARIFRP